ncbi:MAG: hypothetical protein RBR98_01710 [Candidatus Moranbacteria bacterium]|jgi:hypothetical protein|nr:hypothetical protein [Candidatus Moranbacteria bacterium]
MVGGSPACRQAGIPHGAHRMNYKAPCQNKVFFVWKNKINEAQSGELKVNSFQDF